MAALHLRHMLRGEHFEAHRATLPRVICVCVLVLVLVARHADVRDGDVATDRWSRSNRKTFVVGQHHPMVDRVQRLGEDARSK